MNKAAAKKSTTTPDEAAPLGTFGSTMLDIGWQLAIAVIGFLWLGKIMDQYFNTKPVFILIALVLVVISFILIVRRAVRNLPKAYGGQK